jgi:hypothetical protein
VTEVRALTRLVVLDGEVWEAGSVPPPEVAERIRNPQCWAPIESEPPLPWGPEGMPQISTATQPVIPAAPAENGIANLQEQAGGTEQSGVIAAQPGNVIGRDPAETVSLPAPAGEPTATEEPPAAPVVDEQQPVEKPAALLPEPPRSGKGSSEAVWRAYAEQFDADIPADADRAAIIAQLKDDGYIQ